MRLLVFGSTGRTGRAVVKRALADGHEVTAFVRHDFQLDLEGVRVAKGDATRRTDVDAAMIGQEAVIDAIGTDSPYKETDVESSAAAKIIASMEANGARRLLVVSMLGTAGSEKSTPVYERLLLKTFLRGAKEDKTTMELAVRTSNLLWTIVRPPFLTEGPRKRDVRVIAEGSESKAHKITREDLAAFMVQQLASDAYILQAVVVANS